MCVLLHLQGFLCILYIRAIVCLHKKCKNSLTHVKLLIVWEHNPSISKIVNEIFGSMKKLQYLCYRYPENNLFTLNVN